MTDAERLERIKSKFPDPKEAADILAYDKAVERNEPTKYDLPPDKLKVAQQFARTGTRKVPMIPNLPKKQYKRNATQDGIIDDLQKYLASESPFEVENVARGEKGYTLEFAIGSDRFKLTVGKMREKKE